MNLLDAGRARALLCSLGDAIREEVVAARERKADAELAAVARETRADTIYDLDVASEAAVIGWFERHWPAEWPVELVMEGLDSAAPMVFPPGTPTERLRFTCIIDPIDGTRGLMYQKRSAWALAALAPREGSRPARLRDIQVAAMTEIPVAKQTVTDQISGIAGRGRDGLLAERRDPEKGRVQRLEVRPSAATDFRHGFAGFCKYFPEGRALTASLEEALWRKLGHLTASGSPVVFDDQYISTGGQIYELLTGHDRMVADLRPQVLRAAGFPATLVCHPYDICTGFLLIEAGGVLESPDGGPVDAPLDTTSAVSWIGWANEELAALVRPILRELLKTLPGAPNGRS